MLVMEIRAVVATGIVDGDNVYELLCMATLGSLLEFVKLGGLLEGTWYELAVAGLMLLETAMLPGVRAEKLADATVG